MRCEGEQGMGSAQDQRVHYKLDDVLGTAWHSRAWDCCALCSTAEQYTAQREELWTVGMTVRGD